MPITIDLDERYGKQYKCITVDMSDRNHNNRIFEIYEDSNPLDNSIRYIFRVQGIQYHPDIILDKSDFLKFAEAVKTISDDIRQGRQ